jgi:glucose 1-dehydrogenase
MKAIAFVPKNRRLEPIDLPEPVLGRDSDMKMCLVRVGICGTDRDEIEDGRVRLPSGKNVLIVGHEMLGQVVEVGRSVKRVKIGDYAVFTVRRGCGQCLPCRMNGSDMCLTGEYTERGIWGRDGHQAEYVVDDEQCVVRVIPELEPIAVLTEPLAVAEKAIDSAFRVQCARLPGSDAQPDWFHGRKCLVAGLGPAGLLACLALVIRGAEVHGLDIVDRDTARPRWLEAIGGRYIDGRKVTPDRVGEHIGLMEVLFDATGSARLQFNLLNALGRNGIYVVTGIPTGGGAINIEGSELMSRLVLDNQVMMGSVNDARGHFQMRVDDLRNADLRWGSIIGTLITRRYDYTDYLRALSEHQADEIKTVVEWNHSKRAA